MAVTAKGGKYFYAWSKILPDGSYNLPEQALQEYHIRPETNVILMSGRNTSKGFSVVCKELIENSPLAKVYSCIPGLKTFSIPEGQAVEFKERVFCWTYLSNERYIQLPLQTWNEFGVAPGDKLLSLRATHLGFNNVAEGPFIELAKQVRGVPILE